MHCLNSKTHDKKRKQYISYQKKVFVEFLEICKIIYISDLVHHNCTKFDTKTEIK